MLREEKGVWSVACERCHVRAGGPAPSLDEAFKALHAIGWLDQARKGKGRANYPWLCVRCRPGDGSGQLGRAVGAGK